MQLQTNWSNTGFTKYHTLFAVLLMRDSHGILGFTAQRLHATKSGAAFTFNPYGAVIPRITFVQMQTDGTY